jgi:hypothetical protein
MTTWGTTLDLRTRWRIVVSFKLLPLYLQGNGFRPSSTTGQKTKWGPESISTLMGHTGKIMLQVQSTAFYIFNLILYFVYKCH